MRFHGFAVGIACVGMFAASAAAQRPYMLHYDTTTVTTVSGHVLSVQSPAPMGRGMAGMQVVMGTGTDSLVVHLGPSWVLQRGGITLGAGDQIEITGSKVTLGGKPAIVAAELRKGSQRVTLRDAKGTPQWTRRGL